EALPGCIAGTMTPEPPDAENASHTPMLTKVDCEVPCGRPATILARLVRAFNPWPGAYTHWRGKLLKIHIARVLDVEPGSAVLPGTVTIREVAGHKVMAVATGKGLLLVKQLQLEGKKEMG